MSYMKQDFENWIKTAMQGNGEPYSKETISNYIYSLRTHASKLSDVSIRSTDLFDFDNLSDYDDVCRIIKNSSNYEKVNTTYHRIFSSALLAYRQFLTTTVSNAKANTDMTEQFEEWLKNYKNHKYSESTIQRYIRALKKAEDWLHIVLPQQVLQVDTLTEFQEVQTLIKSVPDFADINQSHGHGDLSAALAAYEKFLQTELAIEYPNQARKEGYRANTVIPVSTKDAIEQIKRYIAAKGFRYKDELIENFFLCLKSKPFVILAGTSGTGKTRLVKLFAEAIGAEYKLVSVRPDWSDGSDLFGHNDLNGNFIKGPVCDCFDIARKNPNKPVLLCLDEMNLARVEYYLSDFLSVIESREKYDDGMVVTEAIAQYKDGIPDNIYVIGTVNMDETTFPFSKKVLDRANTIEFSYVDLSPSFDMISTNVEKLAIENDFLRTEYLVLAKDCVGEKQYVEDVCEKLKKINEILQKANAHVGYRTRDEIVFYMLNNKNAGYLLSDSEALDLEIMQKILPRIQGSTAAIKELLVELYKYCLNDFSGIDADGKDIGEKMQIQATSATYPISAAKIGYMMTRYEEDGFTSYWL